MISKTKKIPILALCADGKIPERGNMFLLGYLPFNNHQLR